MKTQLSHVLSLYDLFRIQFSQMKDERSHCTAPAPPQTPSHLPGGSHTPSTPCVRFLEMN